MEIPFVHGSNAYQLFQSNRDGLGLAIVSAFESTFIEVYSVVMLTTSQTATSWMFSVLANTTMAVTDVASQLSGVAESGRHCRDSKLLVDELVVMGQAVAF